MLRILLLTFASVAAAAFSADEEGFTSLFNGKDLGGWKGPVENYEVKDGAIVCKAGKGGTIYTTEEYADFVVRLEVKIPAGCNNGLAIRYPGGGDTAYVGMCELQVLDNDAPKYARLDPRQCHGSAYGKVNMDEVMGKKPHPGKDRTSGYFGLAGHNDLVLFRNVRIKRL